MIAGGVIYTSALTMAGIAAMAMINAIISQYDLVFCLDMVHTPQPSTGTIISGIGRGMV